MNFNENDNEKEEKNYGQFDVHAPTSEINGTNGSLLIRCRFESILKCNLLSTKTPENTLEMCDAKCKHNAHNCASYRMVTHERVNGWSSM